MRILTIQLTWETLFRKAIGLILSLVISLSAITSMFTIGVDSAYAASSNRIFNITNASNGAVSVSIHSRTKANATWTPNLFNPDEKTAKKIALGAGTAITATAAATGVGAPIATTGAVLTAASDPALSAIYGIYDSRLAARTVVIPPGRRATKTISVLRPYKWKRRYVVKAICSDGHVDEKRFGYTKSTSFSTTVCQ